MGETKCEIHAARVEDLESRVERLEKGVDSLVVATHQRDLESAMTAQVVDLLKAMISDLKGQVNEILNDRIRILAGLVANGAIGATSIGILLWVLERIQ